MKNFLNAVTKTIKRQSQYSQTMRELNALDNRSLADLGISRSDIASIARDQSRTIL